MDSSSKMLPADKRHQKVLYIIVSFLLVIAITVAVILSQKKASAYMVKSDFAMGSDITLCLYSEDNGLSDDVFSAIHTLDNTISRNIADSEVSKINSSGGARVYAPETCSLLEKLSDVTEISHGRFNPVCGTLTSLWDIGGTNQRLPAEDEISAAVLKSSYTLLDFSDGYISLSGCAQLDLGAIGKGAACDIAAPVLGENPAVLSVGGSVRTNGIKPDKSDWKIGIRDPFNADSQVLVLTVSGTKSISTSGSYEKYFSVGDKTYHHILDTSTGYPFDSDIVSATVICTDGALSDALSTAVFASGKQNAAEILKKSNASGIIIDRNKAVYVSEEIYDKISSLAEGYTLRIL